MPSACCLGRAAGRAIEGGKEQVLLIQLEDAGDLSVGQCHVVKTSNDLAMICFMVPALPGFRIISSLITQVPRRSEGIAF